MPRRRATVGDREQRAIVLTTVDLAERSAAPAHVAAICDVLQESGYLVELLATSRPGDGFRSRAPATQVRVARGRLPRWLPTSAAVLLLLGPLARRLLTRRPVLVYIRCASATSAAVLVARLLGARMVVSEHNGWLRDELEVLGHSALAARAAELGQVLEGRAAHLVRAVVPEIAAKLVERGVASERVVVAGNGTWVRCVRPLDRASCLASLDLPPERRYLGFLGKLSAWQGVDHAVTALGALALKHPDLDLLIAGDGPERERLHALAASYGIGDRVIFLGEVTADEIPQTLSAMDIALAPKTTAVAQNGMSPLKVRDYAAAGLPVIAPAVPGFEELEPHGWMATYGAHDPASLTDAIDGLLADPLRLRDMGDRARAFAVDNFDWTVTLRPLLDRLHQP